MDREILAVQRMQDYIAMHLDDEITLADLSRVSFYSPWHAHRLFSQHTGYTVARYIRSMRLSRAALRLRDSGLSVTEASFDAGFGSVDGFQRAFKDEFRINPKSYSKNSVPIPLFIPYGVKYRKRKERIDLEKLQNVFVSIAERPERKVLIKRGIKADEYFSYCEEVGCDIWGILKSMDDEPVSLYLTEKYIAEGTSSYVQGVEKPIDWNGAVPEGFDIITLPRTEYIMFQGEKFREEDYEEAILAVKRGIERFSPSALGYEWSCSEPAIQLEPIGERGYIELVPVRKKR